MRQNLEVVWGSFCGFLGVADKRDTTALEMENGTSGLSTCCLAAEPVLVEDSQVSSALRE